ncbi:hypothetical protein [Clostridium kluyveri]|uniref:Uncharacterized protein n=1 Tax=Clostridium kluyveri TaxID=1534 RepID=A0A1L5FC89_CLOKL|nr:hypothetical protein [Clostridium kluyveri]APM40430.1 hypothetical protein BS101_17645 [Clostridium kluyveri]UZQ49316.1 hypothetical protein OP486_15345 [Clostridium kluyveri]
MSINFNKFVPRPGLVNKQGRLPDPSELVCIEVPKVFDQCLIKRCLVYNEGPDTNKTDCELRSNALADPKRYLGSRDFNIKLISVDRIPIKRNEGFKKVIISYVISFYADYIDCNNVNKTEFYEINRTDVIGKFYCPDSIAETSGNFTPAAYPKDTDSNIIKLEMVADALDGELVEDSSGNFVLDITLGYYIIVKCELIVQLLIPAYSYCPIPDEPCEESEENPCEIFERTPVPKFYPDQNLEPLFPYYDSDEDSTEIL